VSVLSKDSSQALTAWEQTFVALQSSAHGCFQRALQHGDLEQAEMAARETGWLNLIDACSLVVAYARSSSPKFEPGAARWRLDSCPRRVS
jgi:hypothetical protein